MEIVFEWDDVKAERNLVKHRMSFERATEVFADPNVVIFDVTRKEDGEARFKAIGRISGRLYTAVYNPARRCKAADFRPAGECEGGEELWQSFAAHLIRPRSSLTPSLRPGWTR